MTEKSVAPVGRFSVRDRAFTTAMNRTILYLTVWNESDDLPTGNSLNPPPSLGEVYEPVRRGRKPNFDFYGGREKSGP